MDFETHLLALLGSPRIGDEVFAGLRLTDASSELGLRLTFETAQGAEIHVEVEPADPPRPHAARSAHLVFSYRLGRGGPLVDPRLGRALCVQVAALASRHEASVLARLASAALEARSEQDGTTRLREVHVERLLQAGGTLTERYYTLSPYVGCLIGCRFCYAQSRLAGLRSLERLPDTPWGSYVDVRINAAEVLARELTTLPLRAVKFCPIVSDPYQAVEKRYRVTRACLEVLRDAVPARTTLVLTRSRLVERDTDVLAAMPRAYVGASIPTADDEVRAHFEPRGAAIADRFAALRTLRSAGVRTFAIVQPMLPGSVDALADALAETVTSVRIDVLYGVEQAAADFADPRFAGVADESWQRERAESLASALRARGIALWRGELPPDQP